MNGSGAGRVIFPDPNMAGDDGLLCAGGDLRVETLLSAYSQGIFPWPQEGLPLLWFSPPRRGVLDFSEVHWPRRFLRELRSSERTLVKQSKFTITFNRDFARVIRACAQVPQKNSHGTWILPPMEGAYMRFHEAGFAHSVECWRGDIIHGEMVGGLYGVYVGGVFSGESMFQLQSGASKRCLFALIERLQAQGLTWMDTQMVTPILQSFGGKYIARDEFLERLKAAQKAPCHLDLGQ